MEQSINKQPHEYDISVPENWTVRDDVSDYLERFGLDPLYKDNLRRIASNFAALNRTVNHSIQYLIRVRLLEPLGLLEQLALEKRLDYLGQLIREHPPKADPKNRFEENLDNIRKVESERNRILWAYYCDPEAVRVYELSLLADLITVVDFELDESMVCEYEDCKEFFSDLTDIQATH